MEESDKIDFLATLLPLSLVIFIIVLGVLLLNQQFNKKLFQQKLEAEELKIRNQHELLRASIQAQEDERKRIARDLHDELGAALSMARMQLVQLEQTTSPKEVPIQKLENTREIIEIALSSMRRISHELIPPQLEHFGLLQTLASVRTQVELLETIHIHLVCNADFPRLPIAMELGMYRICLELINNTLKHAQATTIEIELTANEKGIQLDYSDNGIGFQNEEIEHGLGHKNIEARVNSLNGACIFTNKPENGMHARVSLPIY